MALSLNWREEARRDDGKCGEGTYTYFLLNMWLFCFSPSLQSHAEALKRQGQLSEIKMIPFEMQKYSNYCHMLLVRNEITFNQICTDRREL